MNSREAIYAALFARLQAVNTTLAAGAPAIQTFTRRFVPTSRMDLQPALVMVETGEEYDYPGAGLPARIVLAARVFIYTRDGADPDAVSATALNRLIDSIEASLFAVFPGEQTLGGLVKWTRMARRRTVYDAAQDVTQATTTMDIRMLASV